MTVEKKLMGKKYKVKMVLLGAPRVGKTSMVEAYLGKTLKRKGERRMGVNIYTKLASYPNLLSEGVSIEWHIWDIQGDAPFQEVEPFYYRGARGALLLYDISRKETLCNLSNYFEEVLRSTDCHCQCVVVGHKTDLRGTEHEVIPPKEGEKVASEISNATDHDVPYLEASAKTGDNIEKAFETLAMLIVRGIMQRKKTLKGEKHE